MRTTSRPPSSLESVLDVNAHVGLALGGGGALGAAHVGVLQVFAEGHICPEIITGTSAGALVGAAYAAGLPLRTIERLILDATWSDVARISLAPRLGLFDTRALADTISTLGGDPLIEDLPRRFGAVATDLRTRSGVVLTEGPLAEALRASIAVPGLFPPVRNNGRLLVDGGIAANLPIEGARDMGADTVFAVRLRPEWERLPIIRSAEKIARMEQETSTILIQPDLRGMAHWSLADVPRLIDAGRAAATEVLSALQAGNPAVA